MKPKSYNRLPNPLLDAAVYAAAGAAAGLLTGGLAADAAEFLLESIGPFLGSCGMLAPEPDPAVAVAIWTALLALVGVAAAADRYCRFHCGAWLGPRPSRDPTYGTARLESRPSRLLERFRAWREGEPPEPGIVVGGIGGRRDLLLTSPVRGGALLLGGTGAGKTTSVLAPTQTALIRSGASCLTTDPKGELWALTGAFSLAQPGRKTILLDFSDPWRSDSWNPLQPALDCAREEHGRRRDEMSLELRILADALIPRNPKESSPIWSQGARMLFLGIAAFVAESPLVPDDARNLATVAELVSVPQEDLAEIVGRLPNGSPARTSLMQIVSAAEETFAGFRSNYLAHIEIYGDPAVSRMLGRSDFRAEDFLKGPVQVYARFSSTTGAYDALVTALASSTIGSLRRLADCRCAGTLPIETFLLLEEFPQIPKLENFARDIAVTRSTGIRIVIAAQDRSQITARYGQDAGAIFANCDQTVFCASSDLETNDYYSRALGCYTAEVKSRTRALGTAGSGSEGTSLHEVPLFRKEDLARWDYRTGHLVITKDGPCACSSRMVSETFAGDMLGLDGKEPDAAKLAELAPKREVRNPEPAKVWRWKEAPDSDTATSAIADAIAEMGRSDDPRYL